MQLADGQGSTVPKLVLRPLGGTERALSLTALLGTWLSEVHLVCSVLFYQCPRDSCSYPPLWVWKQVCLSRVTGSLLDGYTIEETKGVGCV